MLLPSQLRLVADADDIHLLREALGDTGHGVGDERPRQAVEGRLLISLRARLSACRLRA